MGPLSCASERCRPPGVLWLPEPEPEPLPSQRGGSLTPRSGDRYDSQSARDAEGRPLAGPGERTGLQARGHEVPGATPAPAAAASAAAAGPRWRRSAIRPHLGVPGRSPVARLVRPGEVRHLRPLGRVLRAQFWERMVLVSAPPSVSSDPALVPSSPTQIPPLRLCFAL